MQTRHLHSHDCTHQIYIPTYTPTVFPISFNIIKGLYVIPFVAIITWSLFGIQEIGKYRLIRFSHTFRPVLYGFDISSLY